MEIDLIETLALEKIEVPDRFDYEAIVPIVERMFTSNPYQWEQTRNYELLGSPRPLWLIEKWFAHSFELYHGSYPFEAPNLIKERERRYHSEGVK